MNDRWNAVGNITRTGGYHWNGPGNLRLGGPTFNQQAEDKEIKNDRLQSSPRGPKYPAFSIALSPWVTLSSDQTSWILGSCVLPSCPASILATTGSHNCEWRWCQCFITWGYSRREGRDSPLCRMMRHASTPVSNLPYRAPPYSHLP